MIRKSSLVVLCLCSFAMANTVAITEFINNADNEDSGREWVELFNYGSDAVDLSGWTLSDEDNDSVTLTSLVIPSGGYAIIVNGSDDLTDAEAKSVFETEWLNGVADSRVIGVSGMALGNSTDEIILSDASNMVSWSLAYPNGESDNAVYLTDTQNWGFNVYGSKATPGIERDGNDVSGTLGYEDNSNTADAFAYAGDFNAITGLFDGMYADVDEASMGSPLAGNYVAVPEPGTLAMIGLGVLMVIRRK